MRKNDFSQGLAALTATRGIHYNVKVNAYRSRAPIVSALCLTTSERSKGFRRNEGDCRKSGAGRDASKDDCRERHRHNGFRLRSVEWTWLRAGETDDTAICRRCEFVFSNLGFQWAV